MEFFKTILFFGTIITLVGCGGSRSKKSLIDPRTQIDCFLDEEELNAPQIHAKDIARKVSIAQKLAAQLIDDPEPIQLSSEDLLQFYEAKFTDIPIPFGATPLKDYFQSIVSDSSEVILGYISDLPIEEIALFYVTQMEQLGWKQIFSFAGIEHLLSFERSSQLCIISLRPQNRWFQKNSQINIIIFRGDK